MVDVQNAHIGAAPRAALLGNIGNGIKARMKETGPLATPPVDPTTSFSGRRRLKEKPVPPPLL